MRKIHCLIIMLLVLAVAAPASAKKDKDKGGHGPKSMLEALVAAPLFTDSFAQERGQKLLDEACGAMLDPGAVCDLVIKDADLAGFYFKPDSGVMLTTVEMMNTLKDEELRAAFAWAIAYAKGGLREKAAKMQKDRADALKGLAKINPSVGAGAVQVQGNMAVGAGVSLGPGAVLAIADGVSSAVEDARLEKELRAIDAEVTKKLYAAGFGEKGMVKLLKRAMKEGDNYLADREIGIGRVSNDRLRRAQGK